MKQIDPRLNKQLYQLAADIYDAIDHGGIDTPAIELLEGYGKWVWNKAIEEATKSKDKKSILKLRIQ